jgi:alkaline phosphatase/secreted PhoX family phosphatase
MAKNVIIMIGDGMGWEMARAAAIQAQINEGATGTTLENYYLEGKGSGLSFQTLTEYTIATTYSTFIANSKENSALEGNPLNRPTGDASVREGFEFDPSINPGGNLAGYDVVKGRTLPWDAAYYGGEAPEGFDPDYIKQNYADSANTATTLYTGQKTYTGALGVDIFEEAVITLAEVALNAGKSAGVVSSVPINHATPGAAIAHVSHRNKYHEESVKDANGDPILPEDDNIFWDILNDVKPTVVLGGGHPAGPGSTYINPDNLAQLRNGETIYTFLERGENAAQTLADMAATLDPDQGDRLMGLYGARGQGGNLPWSTANGDYSNTGLSGRTDTTRPLEAGETVEAFIAKEINKNPTLVQLTSAALDVLGSDDQGFWLMVEGGDVDWAAHDNNIDNLIGTTFDFANSVEVVIDWIGQNGGWEENLLIVTADHDHYLTLNDNFPQLLQQQGAEALTAAANPTDAGHFWGSDPTVKYGWGSHSNRPVPVYYQGDGADVLISLIGEGYEAYATDVPGIPELVDQVHVHAAMTTSLVRDIVIDGKTEANPYVFNVEDVDPVTDLDPNYQIIPLLTVGDEVPYLEGEFGSFTPSTTQTYAMAGIPDGLGISKMGDKYYVWMNHEIASPTASQISSTSTGTIKGARVSLFVFDENWNAIGGKNLIEFADADGTTYTWNPETGNYESATGKILNMLDHENFTRFCSGYLAASGFVDENGQEIPIYFAPEETTEDAAAGEFARSRGWAVSPDGTALALTGLGIFAKEQVYAASQYRAKNSDYTVLFSTEDYKDGELYAYIGKQTEDNANGFTTNPSEFDLYVLRVKDANGNVFAYETMPENVELTGEWVLVPEQAALGSQQRLSEWVNAGDRSTNFRRLEDMHEDPHNPGTFYFVTTGTNDKVPGTETQDNNIGKLHRFTFELDESGKPTTSNFEFLLQGGENTGVSYDNITVDHLGNVLIQEDRTAAGGTIMDSQMRNGRVLSYNIAYNEDKVGNDEITFLFEIDQTVEGNEFDNGFGDWESSGIVEVPGMNGTYLFDVQAHGIPSDRYVEGGQLILAIPEFVPATLVGFSSLPADTFAPALPGGSGNFITSDNRETPFEEQPVQGFSGVQFAGNGEYWFLSDNGYGNKANSADYLLRIYKVDPDFKTAEDGSGVAEWTDFIQLSDPNGLIPWEIVRGGNVLNTSATVPTDEDNDRKLTGADFDPESIVLTDDRIWVGEEFGPYILEFNLNGELVSEPIATPNIFELNTLDGSAPITIAHRGASGYRPEHTTGFFGGFPAPGSDPKTLLNAAYNLGIDLGADFIEPDLVPTKDGVLIARHENALAIVETDALGNPLIDANGNYVIKEETTNVAEIPFFRNRLTAKTIDGQKITGWFSEDFTLFEIKNFLRAKERIPQIRPDNTNYNYLFTIPTLGEIIDLVNFVEATTGKKIGIYPETKHPTFFKDEGKFLDGVTPININTSQILVDTLVAKGFTDPDRLFLQSFEITNLKELHDTILPAVGLDDIPLVQLISGSGAPYDAVYQGLDITYDEMSTAEGLLEIATYADGVGPSKTRIVNSTTLESTTFVDDAHAAGLQVHPYTFRSDPEFLPAAYSGNPEAEYELFTQLGVDGFFSDFPDTAKLVTEKITADYVSSPDNPEGKLANLARSRGFEGMAYSPDRTTLYPLLEGAVMGDPDNALRIYEFDVATKTYAQDLVGFYGLDDPSHAIGDFTPINDNEFLVIERDGGQGASAQFKKIFKVDFSNVDAEGYVAKTELVDLLNIADPNDLNGDGSKVFTFPFVTIEDVLVLDEETILVANDNNYPFSIGRGPDIDNNEIITLKLNERLNLDPRLGAQTSELPVNSDPDSSNPGTNEPDETSPPLVTEAINNPDITNSKTSAPAYVFNLDDVDPTTGKNPEFDIVPLITVGEEVAYLEGDFGNFTPSNTKTYAMAGIPDGLGISKIEDKYYVWMNHEIASPTASQISSTVDGKIKGARVSLFVFDHKFNAIGGKNLIEFADAGGTTYTWNPETGNYESDSGQILNMLDHENFTRFCSGYLAASGFVDADGNPAPIWFAPEETTEDAAAGEFARSRGWAVSPDGTALGLDGLGIYAKEQVYAASQYRATNSDYTVVFSTEDYFDGELYAYVGKQTAENPNGFTTNPDEFDLYVLRVKDANGKVFAYETMPENVDLTAEWVLVPDEAALGSQQRLSEWVNAENRSTNFRRLEDMHEDPNKAGTFYLVTTGTNDKVPGTETQDNNIGKLHRFTFALDESGKPTTSNFEFLLKGGENTGVSYDNITVDRLGNVLIQEDRTAAGGAIMDSQMRNGRVLSYNIAYNENKVGNDDVTFLFEINQDAEGSQYDNGFGGWESSGIVEVPGMNGAYLFDVQANGIKDGGGVYEGNYVEGGQLILTLPKPVVKVPRVVSGTPEDDYFDAAFPDEKQFIGDNQILSTGGGDDMVDVSSAPGGNTIRTASGDDEIYAGTNNRIVAGAGDDLLFLGSGGGNNRVTGGSDADQFWITEDDDLLVTNPNIIGDYNAAEGDVIGFLATSLSFGSLGTNWNYDQDGLNTVIEAFGQDIAILNGINAATLSESNFVFM